MRPDLPVYIAAGESDPVNGQLTLLTPLADRYRAAGLTDVTVRTYPQARHEILNEINNAEVIAAIASWVDRVLSSARPSAAGGQAGTGQAGTGQAGAGQGRRGKRSNSGRRLALNASRPSRASSVL